jgi:HK97 family phage prohead protease
MKILSAPFEVKELDERGSFEGMASVYGNVDLGGDVVEAGAFKEIALTRDGFVRILDSHMARSPIGKGKLIDTHVGLAVKGQLNLAIARAREVYELMKDHVIEGLSIGYDVLPGGAEITQAGVRLLKAVKLWEISTTPFPMNEMALVERVKSSIERVNSVRELEDMLRDAAGLSRAQAKLHASAIWKTLSGQRDVDGDGDISDEVQQTIERFKALAI